MATAAYHGFSFSSQRLEDTVSIEVALPKGYEEFPDKEYASIYMLDANYFFDEGPGTLDEYLERGEGMTKIVQSLTETGTIPPSVLIGIGYTEEQRTAFTTIDVASFYEFVTDELIPEIESKYRVSKSGRDRVLFGYSGSAHFSTYALLYDVYTGVETFTRVISISGVYDSSLETYKLEERIFDELERSALAGRSLFLAIGADDPKTDLLNAHRSFAQKLANRGYTDFELTSIELAGKGHYDIPEYAFSEGLAHLFSKPS